MSAIGIAALPVIGISFLGFLTISGNRSRSYTYEQRVRDTLANQGRSEEAEQYLESIYAWRKAGWITHLGTPPMPNVGWKDINK